MTQNFYKNWFFTLIKSESRQSSGNPSWKMWVNSNNTTTQQNPRLLGRDWQGWLQAQSENELGYPKSFLIKERGEVLPKHLMQCANQVGCLPSWCHFPSVASFRRRMFGLWTPTHSQWRSFAPKSRPVNTFLVSLIAKGGHWRYRAQMRVRSLEEPSLIGVQPMDFPTRLSGRYPSVEPKPSPKR